MPSKQPTKKKAERKGKVKAVKAWAVMTMTGRLAPANEPYPHLWAKKREATQRDWFKRGVVRMTLIPGHIGKDFKIVPLP